MITKLYAPSYTACMSFRLRVSEIRSQRWEDGSVLFNRLSGDTLFFDELATNIVDILRHRASSRSEACQALADQLGISVDNSLTTYINSLIARLRDLGLLEEETLERRKTEARHAEGVDGRQRTEDRIQRSEAGGRKLATPKASTGDCRKAARNQESRTKNKEQEARLRIGRFTYAISIRIPEALKAFRRIYANYPCPSDEEAIDFHVSLDPYFSLKRPWQRLAVFSCDGVARFGPFPRREAIPYLEWGMNSCVARWSPHHLMVHAATVEREGEGIVLAGSSGSGKSTLAAALMQQGHRLLSDEFALIRIEDGDLDPLVRPVCVKNEMIPRMQAAFPEAVFGPASPGERKGIVAHMRPPDDALTQADIPAPPSSMIFVQHDPEASTMLTGLTKAEAMKRAVAHCFNYKRLGERGFELLAETVDRCACHELTFADAFDAAKLLDKELGRKNTQETHRRNLLKQEG